LHFNASTYKSGEGEEQETTTATKKEEVKTLIVAYLILWTISWIRFQRKAEQ
jgi:hypothetical protein